MQDTNAPRGFSLRGFTSLLLMGLFVVLGLSGAMLYASPRGRVANWTDWTLLGLEKGQWEGLHLNGSLLFLIVAVLHLVLNWRPFWGYITDVEVVGSVVIQGINVRTLKMLQFAVVHLGYRKRTDKSAGRTQLPVILK